MQLRKLISGALGLLMTGATLMGGAMASDLSTWKTEFTNANTMVVVGSTAAAADIVGAINVATVLGQHGATSGGAAEVSVTGGTILSTTNTPIHLGDALDSAKQTLTSSDLSTTLASETFMDADGEEYDYDQYILVDPTDARTVTFGKSAEDIDPIVYVDMGTDSAAPVYTTRVVFNDPIDFSNASTQGETITLFGNDYTVNSQSTNTEIILFGSGTTVTVKEGETQNVTVGGTTYAIGVVGVEDGETAVVSVNGVSKSMDEDTSTTISGLDVYCKDVYYLPKEAQVSSVKLNLGTEKLTLKDGQTVKTGKDDTAIKNTLVAITGAPVSTLEIAVAAQESDTDHIAAGSEYEDPVFDSFKVAFGSISPDFTSTSREEIALGVSGEKTATVKFTDKRGNTDTVDFAYDADPTDNNNDPILSDRDADAIIVVEGQNATEDDYIVVNAGDFAHIMEVTDITPATGAEGTVTLKDVMSGTSYETEFAEDDYTETKVIDGQTYYINVSDAATDTISVTWGAGRNYAVPGDEITVYPVIETRKGADLALAANTSTAGGTLNALIVGKHIILPTGTVNISAITAANITLTPIDPAGTAVTIANSTTGVVTVGALDYAVTRGAGHATQANITNIAPTALFDANNINSVGVILVEEEDDDSEYNAVTVGVEITTGDDIQIIEPDFTNQIGVYEQLESNDDQSKGIDEYGTLVTKDTSGDQDTATISYPDSQLVNNVYVLESTATAPTTAGTSGELAAIAPPSTGISKLASEVGTTDKSGMNLVLMGGPAANSLVSELATANKTYTMDQWSATLQSKYIVQYVANAFTTGKSAIIVAGWSADNTRAAALKLMSGDVSGTEVTG